MPDITCFGPGISVKVFPKHLNQPLSAGSWPCVEALMYCISHWCLLPTCKANTQVITVRFARTAITHNTVWMTWSVWAELPKWRLRNGNDLWGNGDIVLSLVFISCLIIWSYTVCGRLVYYIHPLHPRSRTPTEWIPHIREALTAAFLSLSLKPEASLSKPMTSLSKYFLWAWVSESVVPGECWLVPEV